MNSKYSNFLTILLIVIIIAIVGIIAFLGFKFYKTTSDKNKSEEFVGAFVDQTQNGPTGGTSIIPSTKDEQETGNGELFEGVDEGENNSASGGNSSSTSKPKYNGFDIVGTIQIPATGLESPIIARSEYSPQALETAVVELYGPGLNQVGITTISGHNYRNGTFFSNNKKLNVGDKILITDLNKKRLSYTIYDKFEAEDNYSDYMVKDTQGAIEVALSTCTDDAKKRIIILARADV